MSCAGCFASAASVAFGTFANAAFVGAKTVSAPGVDSSSANPAFFASESMLGSFGQAVTVDDQRRRIAACCAIW